MSEIVRLRAEAVEWRAIDDEVLAVDLDHANYLGINRSGALLWEALARGTTRGELIERLQEKFGLDADAATQDVERFLDALRERRLLEDASAA